MKKTLDRRLSDIGFYRDGKKQRYANGFGYWIRKEPFEDTDSGTAWCLYKNAVFQDFGITKTDLVEKMEQYGGLL